MIDVDATSAVATADAFTPRPLDGGREAGIAGVGDGQRRRLRRPERRRSPAGRAVAFRHSRRLLRHPASAGAGTKEGAGLALLGASGSVGGERAPLLHGVTVLRRLDVSELLVTERRALERGFYAVAEAVFLAGGFDAWRKRASKEPTYLTEGVLREVGLPRSLVDNQVCAITDVWSDLRLVWQNENRA